MRAPSDSMRIIHTPLPEYISTCSRHAADLQKPGDSSRPLRLRGKPAANPPLRSRDESPICRNPIICTNPQLINYQRIARHPVGYLINFGYKGTLEWKRFILSEFITDQGCEH